MRMVPSTPRSKEGIYDVIGIGFGPSNLALAAAIDEMPLGVSQAPLTAVFFEKQDRFGWHRGMLFDDAKMQVAFPKDLVTLRCPTSSYSFLSYLHVKGRLAAFLNGKTLFPSRLEFHDYLEWAAERLNRFARYGAEVVSVEVAKPGSAGELLEIVVRDGKTHSTYRTRNLVVAAGLETVMPEGLIRSDLVWHSSEFAHRLGTLDNRPVSVAVVGAGQSAAEITRHVHSTLPQARVTAIFDRYGYSVADDTPFVNQLFAPDAVDEFFRAPEEARERLLARHRNANYAVVDSELLSSLYEAHYADQVAGRQRLEFLRATRVVHAQCSDKGVDLVLCSALKGEVRKIRTDVVICATGYRPADPIARFPSLNTQLERDSRGRLLLERSYQVESTHLQRCAVYVQGVSEHMHGMSASLLSTTACRAGEILSSVVDRITAGNSTSQNLELVADVHP